MSHADHPIRYEIRERMHAPCRVVSLIGEFDLLARKEVEEACQRLSRSELDLVIDLSAVDFIDTPTIELLDLLIVEREARSRASASITPREPYAEVLRASQYLHTHCLQPDLARAVRALRHGPEEHAVPSAAD